MEAKIAMLSYGKLSSTVRLYDRGDFFITWQQIVDSINANSPVFGAWGYQTDAGEIRHTMVICGYEYDDSNVVSSKTITYVIRDPNTSSGYLFASNEFDKHIYCTTNGIKFQLIDSIYNFAKRSYKVGDIDNSGKVNVNDVLLMLRFIANKIPLLTSQRMAADVNKDTNIDVADILIMLRYIAGKTKSL